MLSPSEEPQTMLSPALQEPQTMLSPSEVPHTVPSQSAPPQSLPHTMLSPILVEPHTMLSPAIEVPQTRLSPLVEEPHTMLSPSSAIEPHTMLSPVVAIVRALPQTTPLPHAFAEGFMMPPVRRWLPHTTCWLHTLCTGTRSP